LKNQLIKMLKLARYYDESGQFRKADSIMEGFVNNPDADLFFVEINSLINYVYNSLVASPTKEAVLLYLRQAREIILPFSNQAQQNERNNALELSKKTQFQKTAAFGEVTYISSKIKQLIQMAQNNLSGPAAFVAPKVQELLHLANSQVIQSQNDQLKENATKEKEELKYSILARRYLAYGVKHGEQAMFKHLNNNQSEDFTNHVLNLWRDLRMQQAK
jgi:hypothetical protein